MKFTDKKYQIVLFKLLYLYMAIKVKEKKCKGIGKAIGYGCGSMQLKRVYGLGLNCRCYQNWLLNSEEGKNKLKK